MDAIGEALSKSISNIYEVQALQVFIETIIIIIVAYLLYKLVVILKIYMYKRKRSRSISDADRNMPQATLSMV
jgi:hypothetical protein